MERSAARRTSAVACHLLPQQQPLRPTASSSPSSSSPGTPPHELDREFRFIEVDDDVTLRVVVEGAEDAPLVVLLHGFPQGAPLRQPLSLPPARPPQCQPWGVGQASRAGDPLLASLTPV